MKLHDIGLDIWI